MPTSPLLSEMNLRRYPVRIGDLLQAWDAADELLIENAQALGLSGKRLLIIGDSFGALSTALEEFGPDTYTDSFLGAEAIRANSSGRVAPWSRLSELRGPYDLVIARVPKNLSYLEDILIRLGHVTLPGAPLLAGYMIKHQAAAAFDLIAKYYGTTRTTLAKKKARLILSEFASEFAKAPAASPYPLSVKLPGFSHPFVHHSNLFSREKLDLGTRFFLEHIPTGGFRTIVDLGCGNGVIGVRARMLNGDAKILFTDESRMAVDSAEANFRIFFPEGPAEFLWTHGCGGIAAASADLVLCNPPFHQGNTVGDFMAREMFRESERVLAPGGILRVIGNSHLHYPDILGRIFGNARVIAKNPKFTIVEARKREA